MTTLTHLLVMGAAAPLARLLALRRAGQAARHAVMLVGSVLAVYWLQPLTPIRYLDFWLPTATLALTVWVWAVTRARRTDDRSSRQAAAAGGRQTAAARGAAPGAGAETPVALPGQSLPAAAPGAVADNAGAAIKAAPMKQAAALAPDHTRDDWLTAGVVALLVLGVALLRYTGQACCLTPSRPPELPVVLVGLALIAGLGVLLARLPARLGQGGAVLGVAALGVLGVLFVLKTEPLARAAAAGLRTLAGQAAGQASASDLRWLGFSYVAFRLVHVLRDRALGRMPDVSLRELLTYVVFFPSFTAGPIDRVERFVRDYRQPFSLNADAVWVGGTRLALGVFKKFVLADSLAVFALNAANAEQARGALWLWVLVYAYAWRLYLDFSGYTDIALGLGRWLGIRLPENFDRPYMRQNLTVFWNSWHISLTQWFRAYVFNPLTRSLRARPLPVPAIILITQLVVMGLVGLWHGVTANFVIWGLWHGLGLWVHNRWADFMKPRAHLLDGRPRLKRVGELLGVVVTFHYVSIGWVWFALPSVDLALSVFRRLLGVG